MLHRGVAEAARPLRPASSVAEAAQRRLPTLGTVVFLHGFLEIWYSWRHQMLAVAAAGYRAVAPDWRGYGLSDQPPEPEAASYDDLVEDLLAILDALSIPKVIPLFLESQWQVIDLLGLVLIGENFSW